MPFTGSFKITEGLAKSKDLKAKSIFGQGNATGIINLKRSKLDLLGKIDLKQSLFREFIKDHVKNNNYSIPFSIVGNLEAPNIKINTASIFRSSLKKPLKNILVDQSPKKVKKTLKKFLKKNLFQEFKNLRIDSTNQKTIKIKPSDILQQLLK